MEDIVEMNYRYCRGLSLLSYGRREQ